MSDASQGTTADVPGDLSYASIDTAFAAASVAYGTVGDSMSTIDGMATTAYQQLVGAGWILLPPLAGQDNPTTHYQGVALYKVVNGITEVIIANRGTQPGGPSPNYDLSTSDVPLGFGLEPQCNQSAMNYYNAVTQWLDVNITGPVQIIETGHSLGGEEADYVEARLTLAPPPGSTYAAETQAVTFDAPGLPDQDQAPGANALNISLSTDPVHKIGAIANAGYGGSNVTVNGGISLFWDYVDSALQGKGLFGTFEKALYDGLEGPDSNHSRAALADILSTMPALGDLNLSTTQAGSITQTDVSQMASFAAADIIGAAFLGGAEQVLGEDAQETFTDSVTGSGVVLTGSEGDSLTLDESAGGSGSLSSAVLSDNAGNQVSMTYSSDGTYIAGDSWTDALGIKGTDTYAADGSGSGKVVYASGGYATYFSDPEGNTTWDYYSSSGNLFGASWVHSDGSSGSETLFANGLTLIPGSSSTFDVPTVYFETVQSPDGSYTASSATQQDQETTSTYSATGALVSTSTVQGAGQDYDLTNDTTTTTTDSSGNTLTTVHDAAGDLVSESWTYAAGGSKTITGPGQARSCRRPLS